MAVKKGKTRIIFTLPIRQAEWLKNCADEMEISISKLIRWLIEKNIKNIQQWSTQEELETLIKIAKTKWIIEPEEDDY